MRNTVFVLILLAACLTPAQEDAQSEKPKKVEPGKMVILTRDPEELEIDEVLVDRFARQQDRWFRDGDYPASIQCLRYEYEVYPFSEDVNTSLGWMYGNTSQYDKEIAAYMEYSRRNPDSLDAPYPAAQHYYIKRNFVMAAHLLAPVAKRKEHSHPNTYRILANCYARLGLASEAIKVYDLYLSFAPDDATALAHRNRLARETGVAERPDKGNR